MNRRTRALIAASAAAVGGISIQASGQILYDPVVSLESIGGGTTALSTPTGATTTYQVYENTTPGAAIASASYDNTGDANSLVNTGNGTTEAALANNPSVDQAAVAGTLPAAGITTYIFSAGYTGSDGESAINTTAGAPRVVGYMIASATSASSATIGGQTIAATQSVTNLENATIRGAVGDDSLTNFWVSGNGTSPTGGYQYVVGASPTQLATATNVRTVQILQSIVSATPQNQLYGLAGSGAGAVGISLIGSGTPTTSSQTLTYLFQSAPNSTVASPQSFVLVNDPSVTDPTYGSVTVPYNVAYITDDTTSTNSAAHPGIQKWVYNPAVGVSGTNDGWSLEYVIGDKATGTETGYLDLAGQLINNGSGATDQVVLWSTTNSNSANNLEQFTDPLENAADAGVQQTDGEITLATAPTNEAFRGVAVVPVPVPEPAALGLLGLSGLGLTARRNRAKT